MNTTPISGAQELLPREQMLFERAKSGIGRAFAGYGFQKIETPVLDRTEVLLAKAGGETEKQIYRVYKTGEAVASSGEALRFDLTVPLARYTVEHENDLIFPFRAAQIGQSYRGERAQKGRLREFYQCDIDVIGRNKLPVAYDAEVIAALHTALGQIEGLPEYRMRISNRKLLSGLLIDLGLEDKSAEIFSIVDHAEKVPREQTLASLERLGTDAENVVKITTFMEIRGSRTEVAPRLKALEIENAMFREGVAELIEVLERLEMQLPKGSYEADMLIVRGLDYYTGTVFETMCRDYPQFGSICSGGRYENLAGYYTDQVLPGVGGSIGLGRLFALLQDNGLLTEQSAPLVDVAIVPLGEVMPAAYRLAEQLRAEGKRVDLLLTGKRLWDNMAHAAKIAQYACVLGEKEVAAGVAQLKNLETRELTEVKLK